MTHNTYYKNQGSVALTIFSVVESQYQIKIKMQIYTKSELLRTWSENKDEKIIKNSEDFKQIKEVIEDFKQRKEIRFDQLNQFENGKFFERHYDIDEPTYYWNECNSLFESTWNLSECYLLRLRIWIVSRWWDIMCSHKQITRELA